MAAPEISRGSFRTLAGSVEKDGRTRLLLVMPRSFRPEYELITEGLEINDDVSEPELNNKNISESDDLNSYENNNQFNVIRENDSEIQMEPTSIEWSLFDEKENETVSDYKPNKSLYKLLK